MTHTQLAPQPARKKSKAGLILGIIAIVTVVLCGGAVACMTVTGLALSDSPSDGSPNDPARGSMPSARSGGDDAIGLNQPGRDGKFEFTVTAVECGIASVGTDFLGKTAQGQYCKVSVIVKNIGNVAQMFTSSNQYAFNAAEQRYGADGVAGMYLTEESRAFLEDVNPGNSVNGVILFDIPADSQITRLELHDSAFSGGLTVSVGV